MKFVFYNPTPLAGMPWRTCKVMDKVLREEGGWARCIVDRANYGGGGQRVYPVDLLSSQAEAQQVFAEADIVCVGAYVNDELRFIPKDTPIVHHYSTEHFRWKDKNPPAGTATVVAQYQARFAPQLDLLPNCIPIDDPMFMPLEKPKDRVVVMYTPTSRAADGWACKGYAETIAALKRVATTFGKDVEVLVLENRPYEEVMLARRYAHIVIDECATGSYHSTALEGLACGAVSICWIDDATHNTLLRLLGAEAVEYGLPFSTVTRHHIADHLHDLILNPDLVWFQGQSARGWMEQWYKESWQASMWIDWHRSYLNRFRKRLAGSSAS